MQLVHQHHTIIALPPTHPSLESLDGLVEVLSVGARGHVRVDVQREAHAVADVGIVPVRAVLNQRGKGAAWDGWGE